MARAFNGTSDLMQAAYNYSASGPIPPVVIVTLAGWVYRVDNAADALILEFGNTVNTGYDVVQNQGGAGVDLVRSFWPPNFSWADTYPSPAVGAWHQYVWVIPMGGQFGGNVVFIDGTQQTLTSAGHHPSSPPDYTSATDYLTVGGRLTSGVASRWANIQVAEMGMWEGSILNGLHALTMVDGHPPLFVFDDGLSSYYPLQGDSPEPNIGSGHENFTLTGTTFVRHPPLDSMLGGLYGTRL